MSFYPVFAVDKEEPSACYLTAISYYQSRPAKRKNAILPFPCIGDAAQIGPVTITERPSLLWMLEQGPRKQWKSHVPTKTLHST
ncbi:hypothetical protein M404DRAFT_1001485 [Pisolithus tinctorius Marx 270]|uniref:Uncharacterized protein n=1 Tax=Pisolithus tinctorius Marx 270 TaxID=870435 RepID=A0A0C3K0U1_PISTI|nr:hypothetical protein M404DRAFT_1001485 [Pisolithus tinctorius Marx 270]